MPYFYTDENGNRHGPIDEQRLQTLAERGVFTPLTPLETDTGLKVAAGQIRGLVFPALKPSDVPAYEPPPFLPDSQTRNRAPGFLDIGFTLFITNTWISFIWVCLIIVDFLVYCLALHIVWSAPDQGLPEGGKEILLILVTVCSAFVLLSQRIGLEFIIVVFRIETHLREIRDNFKNR